MKRIKCLFILLCALGTSVLSNAQEHVWKTETANGYTYKYVTNDPMQARFYTLKNGLTVILSPTPKEPRIQAFIAVKAGSKTDPSTNTGLAHYLEHMMFKGTDKFGSLDYAKEKPELDKIDALYEVFNKTKDEAKRKAVYHQIDSISGVASKYSIANEYDKMMSSMGAQGTNAFTSFEETVYTDDIPTNSLDKYLAVQAERFRNPVLRIFHTELEAVYEEKNRNLDNDGAQAFETLLANLFVNHNYGKQTTIGTVEDLKNPSLVEIRKYYNNYYVPNNMGLILSGDFNPDEIIKKIDQDFSYLKNKEITPYQFVQETPITKPIIKEVVGPNAEKVMIGYRLPNNKNKDILIAELVGDILSNGKAGLLDLNLVKKQKLLWASVSVLPLIDYGVFTVSGAPTSGQTLEEVKTLIFQQMELLKSGNFDQELLTSIINNRKKAEIMQSERYGERADILMEAFTDELDWQTQVAATDALSKITKQQVVDFANKYFADNYVAVYKRKGESPETAKIVKPVITPVETNTDKQSAFVKMTDEMPSKEVKPVFLNYDKDIQRAKICGAEVLYVQNKDNQLYRLRYRYKIGKNNDLKQDLAAKYLQFLGTNKKSSEDISKEFYEIASSFNIMTAEDFTMVTIEGLQENFDKAVKLYEDLVVNAVPNEEALIALKARLTKSRTDMKNNKGAILQGLISYSSYGKDNKFNYNFSDEALNKVTAKELLETIKKLNSYDQTIIYYGPERLTALISKLKKFHAIPKKFATPPTAKVFTQIMTEKPQVLFADYDMVQAETQWTRNSGIYDAKNQPLITVFNNYFGGGMGTIVNQTIRESKALAYSTYALYVSPRKKDDHYFVTAYVGSQSDKFADATKAMNELLTDLPKFPENLSLAKVQVKKDIENERIMQDDIIFDYLAARDLGTNKDIREDIYNQAGNLEFSQLNDFYKKNISGKPYTYSVVASEKNLTEADLKKLGDYKKLHLKEIFGY
ncbi:M16 family metallopeptidase [Kaistella jeonii]|uniref:Peptidase M16 n=1 Tax=Kaistella jeonii TaxID=266749 RepID=A0A0C1CX58_9FLAO|nr:M16 family metallopeptidase [Kaistella jeonii]KIA86030.1 peptidase M16 [Kaistella jeonii]SFC36389.1 Predicted Zn-dependent peptidase [Kaistella jeonii]VEI97303.1 Protease 3 precursor [Kaistella jeonii]